ncbi:MAG: sigma-54 dependent transcriptional regulator [Gammaproteobacteria bacterium]|nr:sigma-54 dependent transcriptional regulator [Gammaproteobacteria bacterium]
MAQLLIVDDGDSIRKVLRQLFEYEGHEVRVAASGAEALRLAKVLPPDVTFLDVKLPGMDGLEVLDRLRTVSPRSQVVMISGHGTIATALEATRKGAYDFLEKPLDTDRLLVTLRNALRVRGLSESVALLRSEVDERHEIVGASSALRRVLERVERVAPTDARVLITGENGTGKELVARAVHRLSHRADRAFVELNCAAIPAELIESELFGHMKGSFTGAVRDRAGKFEQANSGTLFLDEIGDMSMSAQAKVLRALEEGYVTRVGGQKTRSVDVRIVTATNKDLAAEIDAGRFREDLFYRLNVVPVHVPPLRERREDIPMLVNHFQRQIGTRQGLPSREIEPDALARLARLEWPGNVRELRNTVERLLILASGDAITVEDVEAIGSRDHVQDGLGGDLLGTPTFREFKERAERAFLSEKLRENDWNVSETARLLDMPRSNLYKRIDRFGLRRGG